MPCQQGVARHERRDLHSVRNTGGNNYDEKDPVTAHNVIHHAPAYPSSIVLSVVPTRKPVKT